MYAVPEVLAYLDRELDRLSDVVKDIQGLRSYSGSNTNSLMKNVGNAWVNSGRGTSFHSKRPISPAFCLKKTATDHPSPAEVASESIH